VSTAKRIECVTCRRLVAECEPLASLSRKKVEKRAKALLKEQRGGGEGMAFPKRGRRESVTQQVWAT
jgi:AmiR/NasT family two-component response regulator